VLRTAVARFSRGASPVAAEISSASTLAFVSLLLGASALVRIAPPAGPRRFSVVSVVAVVLAGLVVSLTSVIRSAVASVPHRIAACIRKRPEAWSAAYLIGSVAVFFHPVFTRGLTINPNGFLYVWSPFASYAGGRRIDYNPVTSDYADSLFPQYYMLHD